MPPSSEREQQFPLAVLQLQGDKRQWLKKHTPRLGANDFEKVIEFVLKYYPDGVRLGYRDSEGETVYLDSSMDWQSWLELWFQSNEAPVYRLCAVPHGLSDTDVLLTAPHLRGLPTRSETADPATASDVVLLAALRGRIQTLEEELRDRDARLQRLEDRLVRQESASLPTNDEAFKSTVNQALQAQAARLTALTEQCQAASSTAEAALAEVKDYKYLRDDITILQQSVLRLEDAAHEEPQEQPRQTRAANPKPLPEEEQWDVPPEEGYDDDDDDDADADEEDDGYYGGDQHGNGPLANLLAAVSSDAQSQHSQPSQPSQPEDPFGAKTVWGTSAPEVRRHAEPQRVVGRVFTAQLSPEKNEKAAREKALRQIGDGEVLLHVRREAPGKPQPAEVAWYIEATRQYCFRKIDSREELQGYVKLQAMQDGNRRLMVQLANGRLFSKTCKEGYELIVMAKTWTPVYNTVDEAVWFRVSNNNEGKMYARDLRGKGASASGSMREDLRNFAKMNKERPVAALWRDASTPTIEGAHILGSRQNADGSRFFYVLAPQNLLLGKVEKNPKEKSSLATVINIDPNDKGQLVAAATDDDYICHQTLLPYVDWETAEPRVGQMVTCTVLNFSRKNDKKAIFSRWEPHREMPNYDLVVEQDVTLTAKAKGGFGLGIDGKPPNAFITRVEDGKPAKLAHLLVGMQVSRDETKPVDKGQQGKGTRFLTVKVPARLTIRATITGRGDTVSPVHKTRVGYALAVKTEVTSLPLSKPLAPVYLGREVNVRLERTSPQKVVAVLEA